MEILSDSRLEYKDIKSRLSKLTARQLYILIYEMHLKGISINFSNNLDYLTNQLQLLRYDSIVLISYIDKCMDRVIGDEYVKWLSNDVRAAIWFDVYWSLHKASISLDRFTLYADFKIDLLRSFDACHIMSEPIIIYALSGYKNNYLKWTRDSVPFSLQINSEYEFTVDTLHTTRRPRNHNSLANSSNPNYKYIPILDASIREDIVKDTGSQPRLKMDFLALAREKYVLNMASDKELKWLDKKNKKQIDWAINHLESKGLLWKPYLFIANNYEDKYDQVRASIDAFKLQISRFSSDSKVTKSTQKEFILAMRNSWYQIRSKEKDPEQLMLNKAYTKKLRKLCDSYGVDSSTYLEDLIDEEFKKLSK